MAVVPAYYIGHHPRSYISYPLNEMTVEVLGAAAVQTGYGHYQTAPTYDNTRINIVGVNSTLSGEGSASLSPGAPDRSEIYPNSRHGVNVTHDVRQGGVWFIFPYDAAWAVRGEIRTPELGVPLVTRSGRTYTFHVLTRGSSVAKNMTPTAGDGFTSGFDEWDFPDTALAFEREGQVETFGATQQYFGHYKSHTITHTFSAENDGTENVIRFRCYDTYGQEGITLTIKLPPVAVLELIENNDPEFLVAANASFDVDGVIVSYTPNPLTVSGQNTVSVAGTQVLWNFEELSSDINDDTPRLLKITVTDNDGLTDYATLPVIISPAGNIGTTFDAANTLHTAVKKGADVQAYRYASGQASQELRGLIEGAGNPSLWASFGYLFCAVQKSDGSYHIYFSDDFARSWEQLTMTSIWDSESYSRAHTCGLPVGGGAASIALRRSTDPAEIYFKYSGDGASWDPDSAAIPVGTYSGSAKQFHVRQLPGGLQLVVTNGVDYARISNGIPKTADDWSDW